MHPRIGVLQTPALLLGYRATDGIFIINEADWQAPGLLFELTELTELTELAWSSVSCGKLRKLGRLQNDYPQPIHTLSTALLFIIIKDKLTNLTELTEFQGELR